MKVYSYKVKRSFVREIPDSQIINPIAAASAARALIDFDREQEQVVAIFMDASNRLKGGCVVQIGAVNQCLLSPREIFRAALLAGAVSVIVAHNHPSGSLKPSAADKETHERLKKAGDSLGVPLLDSIIVAEEAHYSLKSEKEV